MRSPEDIERRVYDFAKPNMIPLKWLIDLAYNSNLATRLGVALGGPVDSVHRSVSPARRGSWAPPSCSASGFRATSWSWSIRPRSTPRCRPRCAGAACRSRSGSPALCPERTTPAMDPGLLRSFGWKPRLSPADAMARAAVEMHAAWRRGENLVDG